MEEKEKALAEIKRRWKGLTGKQISQLLVAYFRTYYPKDAPKDPVFKDGLF